MSIREKFRVSPQQHLNNIYVIFCSPLQTGGLRHLVVGTGDDQVPLHRQGQRHQDREGQEHLGERERHGDDVGRHREELGQGEQGERHEDADGV